MVAFADDQLSVDDWPAVIMVGEAVRLTVGAGGGETVIITDTVIVPPLPVAVNI